jgi:hypothetical protein
VPPAQPPPPLPPLSILASPNRSIIQELDVPQQPSRHSIKYEILEETDAPPHSPPPISSTTQVDLFGQPVFNPIEAQQEEPSAFVKLCTQTSPRQNGFNSVSLQTTSDQKEEVDPFDVQWSTKVLQSARQTQSSNSTPRNNPFGGNESAPVNV